MSKITHDFTEVHAALNKFFSTIPERDAALSRVNTQEDLEAHQEVEDKAVLLVKEAFYRATSSINSYDKCMLVNPWDVANAARYDLTVHFPNAKKPRPLTKKEPEKFDTRRIEGWSK